MTFSLSVKGVESPFYLDVHELGIPFQGESSGPPDRASVLLITGPGHGGPANLANLYLGGHSRSVYPDLPRDRIGLGRSATTGSSSRPTATTRRRSGPGSGRGRRISSGLRDGPAEEIGAVAAHPGDDA